jgi:hypothetical protein
MGFTKCVKIEAVSFYALIWNKNLYVEVVVHEQLQHKGLYDWSTQDSRCQLWHKCKTQLEFKNSTSIHDITVEMRISLRDAQNYFKNGKDTKQWSATRWDQVPSKSKHPFSTGHTRRGSSFSIKDAELTRIIQIVRRSRPCYDTMKIQKYKFNA